MRIFFSDEKQEPSIRLGYTNNLIVAMDSFVSGQPAELSLEAVKSTQVKWMTKKTYMDFIKEDSDLLDAWMQGLVHQQLEREKEILTPI